MPKLGMVMKEGLVVLWHVEEGDQIEAGTRRSRHPLPA
jgi:pyruvate/2-oxoglutarate dehydrogenase complex dihydrolipoamide acyltransferase (E2) component